MKTIFTIVALVALFVASAAYLYAYLHPKKIDTCAIIYLISIVVALISSFITEIIT